ncbi:hypothetical protein ACFWFI_00430 [Streptomyces sp. NPDC060209]|uniref:hypothetical protein n=1 Tax=Streptomyces sp. NPDC060209 TaxID=3347073 RepID=UPI003659013F
MRIAAQDYPAGTAHGDDLWLENAVRPPAADSGADDVFDEGGGARRPGGEPPGRRGVGSGLKLDHETT